MGGCLSSSGSPYKPYILSSSGGEKEYHERYHESKTLGQGEFGIVKLVHDVQSDDGGWSSAGLAVKIVKKGFTFKDNTLYTPLKKEALVAEVEILRCLAGQCYNLRLVDVYESNSLIYIITEYCEGGMMMSWVTKAFGGAGGGNSNNSADGLRTEDVSRISFQLWSALDHCAKHHVIHRDIKPDNIMFCTSDKDSQLRLIDFGSGSLDQNDTTTTPETTNNNSIDHCHHTFAGSGFYISPEMYQREYTSKTDIWSAGTTLYVLVAGYPADQLQETFDLLQSFDSTNNNIKVSGGGSGSSSTATGRIRKLPNLPANLPDSFYDMLEGALCYAPNKRMDAGQLLQCEMAQFHIQHATQKKSNGGRISITEIVADAAAAAAGGVDGDDITNQNQDDGESEFMALLSSPSSPSSSSSSMKPKRTMSVVLEGSVNRHNVYLGYQKFERSVTTVLATMLARETCQQLLLLLQERHDATIGNHKSNTELDTTTSSSHVTTNKKLQVVPIKTLLNLLGTMSIVSSSNDKEVKEVITMIQSLNSFELYENYAYHISLLRQFVSLHSKGVPITNENDKRGGQGRSSFVSSSVHGNNVWKSMKNIRGLDGSGSIRSTSGRSSRRGSLPTITKNTNNTGIGGGEKGGVVVATEENADLSNGGSKSGRGMRRIVSATGVLSSMK
jgi:serine/threonine protein kinase